MRDKASPASPRAIGDKLPATLRLFYWRNWVTNFGDELNPWLFERALPGAFDDDDRTIFVGIGTILDTRIPPAPETVVFGSGCGYGPPPRLDDRWRIACLRGPMTAARLRLPESLAITDPAALVARYRPASSAATRGSSRRVAFMPHWVSAQPAWAKICEELGLAFIHPCWPVERVLDAIASAEMVVAEALHGAIVADALRVPWVGVQVLGNADTLTFKWEDWCASMRVPYDPAVIGMPPALAMRAGRVAMDDPVNLAFGITELGRIARTATPILSDERHLEAQVVRLEEKLALFRRA